MLVLILVIFLGQGLLVDKYDVKCFKRDDKGNCLKGSFNPFYASTHYYELATKNYWNRADKKDLQPKDFDAAALKSFNCFYLNEEFGDEVAEEGGCTPDNF